MDLRIYARNIELTPAAQDYIRKRFDRLERHLKSRSDAKLEISRTSARSQSERVVAQMTVSITHRHAPLSGQAGMEPAAGMAPACDVRVVPTCGDSLTG